MPDPHLSFAKIVATPKETSWSQAYNAGSLFAVLSLEGEATEEQPLNALGKELFNNLEAEFFTLEEKSLASIKQAITNACAVLPETIHTSLCIAYTKETVLYLFVAGNATVVLRRLSQFGVIAQSTQPSTDRSITAVSGFLQDADVVYLETKQFADIITMKLLETTSDAQLPNEIAEILTPHILKTETGAAAAIILTVTGARRLDEATADSLAEPGEAKRETAMLQASEEETTEEETLPSAAASPKRKLPSLPLSQLPRLQFPHVPIGKWRLLIIIVFVLLFGILLISISQTKHHQAEVTRQAQFQQIYPGAKKQYDEGVSLLSLNQELARNDFQSVEKTLTSAQSTFPSGTPERAQIDDLLAKTKQQLGPENGKEATATPADASASPLLAAEQNKSDVLAATVINNTVYTLTKTAVNQQIAGSTDTKSVISNNGDWSDAVGIGAFGSNLYILDRKNGLLKYVAAGSGYTKTNYFPTVPASIASATALAMDSSIYIGTSQGTISKYTKAAPDTFSLTGLDKPLGSVTKLFTSPDLTNLYVLDQQNSRVVVLSKTGTFQSAYTNSQLKDAKDIDVSEKDKKIYFPEQGKVYSINLQ